MYYDSPYRDERQGLHLRRRRSPADGSVTDLHPIRGSPRRGARALMTPTKPQEGVAEGGQPRLQHASGSVKKEAIGPEYAALGSSGGHDRRSHWLGHRPSVVDRSPILCAVDRGPRESDQRASPQRGLLLVRRYLPQ